MRSVLHASCSQNCSILSGFGQKFESCTTKNKFDREDALVLFVKLPNIGIFLSQAVDCEWKTDMQAWHTALTLYIRRILTVLHDMTLVHDVHKGALGFQE